jgi:hypothetical protein
MFKFGSPTGDVSEAIAEAFSDAAQKKFARRESSSTGQKSAIAEKKRKVEQRHDGEESDEPLGDRGAAIFDGGGLSSYSAALRDETRQNFVASDDDEEDDDHHHHHDDNDDDDGSEEEQKEEVDPRTYKERLKRDKQQRKCGALETLHERLDKLARRQWRKAGYAGERRRRSNNCRRDCESRGALVKQSCFFTLATKLTIPLALFLLAPT